MRKERVLIFSWRDFYLDPPFECAMWFSQHVYRASYTLGLLHSKFFGNFNTVAYSCFCRFTLDLSSLILWWYLLLGNLLMWCKPFSANISITLKEFLGFSSFVFGWFSQGLSYLSWLIDSYGLFMQLIYVVDIFMRFIYGWYMCGWFMRIICAKNYQYNF